MGCYVVHIGVELATFRQSVVPPTQATQRESQDPQHERITLFHNVSDTLTVGTAKHHHRLALTPPTEAPLTVTIAVCSQKLFDHGSRLSNKR